MNPWQGQPGYNYAQAPGYNAWTNQVPVPGTVPNNPVQVQRPYYSTMPVSQPNPYAQLPRYPQPQYVQPQPRPPVQTNVQYYQYQQQQPQPSVVYPTHPSSYSAAAMPIAHGTGDHRDSARSRSRSRDRGNQRRSPSPYRNQQSYRSPVRDTRGRSLERERDWSRSPGRTRMLSRSPEMDNRRSRSPHRMWSRSPQRNWSRSPQRNWAGSPQRNWSGSPERDQRWSRSPGREDKWSRSPGRKRQRSRSPGRDSRQIEREKKKVSKEAKEDSEPSDIFKRLEEYKKKFNAMKTEGNEDKPSQSHEVNRSRGSASDRQAGVHKPSPSSQTVKQRQADTPTRKSEKDRQSNEKAKLSRDSNSSRDSTSQRLSAHKPPQSYMSSGQRQLVEITREQQRPIDKTRVQHEKPRDGQRSSDNSRVQQESRERTRDQQRSSDMTRGPQESREKTRDQPRSIDNSRFQQESRERTRDQPRSSDQTRGQQDLREKISGRQQSNERAQQQSSGKSSAQQQSREKTSGQYESKEKVSGQQESREKATGKQQSGKQKSSQAAGSNHGQANVRTTGPSERIPRQSRTEKSLPVKVQQGPKGNKGMNSSRNKRVQRNAPTPRRPNTAATEPLLLETKEQFIKRKQEELQKKIALEREKIVLKRKSTDGKVAIETTQVTKDDDEHEKEKKSDPSADEQKIETVKSMPKIPFRRNQRESQREIVNIHNADKIKSDTLKTKNTQELKRKGTTDDSVKTPSDEKKRKLNNKDGGMSQKDTGTVSGDSMRQRQTAVSRQGDYQRKHDSKDEKAEQESENKKTASKINKSEISEVLKMVLDDDEMAETDDETALVIDEETKPEESTKGGIEYQSVAEEIFSLPRNQKIALIGLQYVTEIIREHKIGFHCSLCGARLDRNSLVSHLDGYKHKFQYFKKNHEHVCHKLLQKTRWEAKKYMTDEAHKIENQYGRQQVVCVLAKDFKFKMHKVIPEIDMSVCPRKPALIIEVEDDSKKENAETVENVSEDYSKDVSTDNFEPEPKDSLTDKVSETKYTKLQDTAEASDAQKDRGDTAAGDDDTEPSGTVTVKGQGSQPMSEESQRDTILQMQIAECILKARSVSYEAGKHYVTFYKFIQNKPEVPLLGLNLLIEVSGFKEGPAVQYVCEMCNTSFLAGAQAIFDHTQGVQHLEKYLKQFHPDKFRKLCEITQEKQRKAAIYNQAQLAFMMDGKGKIKVAKLEDVDLVKAGLLRDVQSESVYQIKEASKSNSQTPVKPSSQTEGAEAGDATGDQGIKVRLFDLLKGLETVPIVGLNYITEIQNKDNHGQPRYQCRLCDTTHSINFINAHLTSHDHRSKFLRNNYPLLYSRTAGTKELVLKYVKEIEERYGRESVWVKTLKATGPNGMAMYSEPVFVKGPWHKPTADKGKGTESIKQEAKPVPPSPIKDKGANPGTEFAKIIEGLDCTPLLGLQYITEVQHPFGTYSAKYECSLCHHIGNGTPLTAQNILNHVSARGHRLNFFREMHDHIYKEILSHKDRKDQNTTLTTHTKAIESTMGRGLISHIVSPDLSYWPEEEAGEDTGTSSAGLQPLPSDSAAGNQTSDQSGSQLNTSDPVPAPRTEPDGPPQPPALTESMPVLTINPKTSPIVQDILLKKDGAFSWKVEFDKMQTKMEEGRIIQTDRKSRFSKAYDDCPAPGIQWILEVQRPNIRTEPYYLCRLCEEKIIFNKIVSHIRGLRHKISYMGQCYPEMYQFITQKKFTNVASLRHKVNMFAEDIGKKEMANQGPVVLMELDIGQTAPQASVTQMQTGTHSSVETSLTGTPSKESWTVSCLPLPAA